MLLKFSGSVVGPLPLYRGTTLVLPQDSGGSQSMELRKDAMHYTPGGPKCLNSWRGSLLNPELLFALKWCLNTPVSSTFDMCCCWVFARGVKVSGGSFAL